MGKTYYYSDELNDDFAGTNIRAIKTPDDYPYFTKNPIRRGVVAFFYHGFVLPLVYLLQKIVYAERIVGRKKLRGYRKEGFFLYGNHTRAMGDAFAPGILSFPKKAFILVSPDTISIPGLRRIVHDLGAVPIPCSLAGSRNFYKAMEKHAEKKHVVAVYPEAHIWPAYTKIRPFREASFLYPVKENKPVFTFTATYRKRLFGGAGVTLYVDGPFFPDQTLSQKESQKKLRDEVYEAMVSRSKLSTYEKNEYIKMEKEEMPESGKEEV